MRHAHLPPPAPRQPRHSACTEPGPPRPPDHAATPRNITAHRCSTRRTPLRRVKSSIDAGVSPGRDGMLFAESVVTLTSASRLLQSLALHSLARTPSAPCRPDGSNGQYRRAKPRAGGLAVARSRRLVGSPIPRSLLGPRRRDPPRRRFGCLKLATDAKLEPRDFIRCSCRQGERRLAFYIELG